MNNQNKRITSKDITKELGIARTLVSFVLNGKNKEMRISEELTNRILKHIENRNYQTNYLVKRLLIVSKFYGVFS